LHEPGKAFQGCVVALAELLPQDLLEALPRQAGVLQQEVADGLQVGTDVQR
jgi:hypothetical protein